ncbi:MAG: tRNA pseudouridine(55) synthase TruB [Defluviitaleaceae bacterium]|nr:tRNA pseudouridine(55) synthase TruB [Defluviitaleaceae bacterium]
MTGFFNVYKEAGYTSHDVVAIIRKLTRGKVGHTGTLDPQAEGVLPICLGRATKLADMVMGQDKAYIAEVVLGVVTDTGDMTGEVVNQSLVSFDEAKILQVVEGFCGQQMQMPPMYSAIKIGGKKLYELARQGQVVERKPRGVNIESIKVLGFQPENNSFTIDVTCSKGTYIRSLCMDIGEALGCGAAMGALLRTRSGAFSLDTAVKIGDIRMVADEGRLNDLVLDVGKVLPFPRGDIKLEGMKMAKNGNTLPGNLVILPARAEGKIWLYGPDGLVGLYSVEGSRLCLEVLM